MEKEISGLCMIINNEDFKIKGSLKEKIRTGSEVDAKRLESLFRQLNFEVEPTKQNRNSMEMREDLKEFKDKIKNNENNYDAMVLIIMSHGKKKHGKDVIFSIDNIGIDVRLNIKVTDFNYNHSSSFY